MLEETHFRVPPVAELSLEVIEQARYQLREHPDIAVGLLIVKYTTQPTEYSAPS